MENFLATTRSFTIKIFEYVVLVSMIVGIIASIIIGIAQMNNPYTPGVMGLIFMLAGIVSSLAGGGAAFLLVGIYHNTKKT